MVKRKIPADTSTDFVSKMEKPCSARRGKIDRSYYELVAFTELKNNIRSGDISVEGSMIHRNIDDYLVDLSACIDSETIPDTFEDYLKDREIILDLQLQFYSTVDKRISRANLKSWKSYT